MFKIELIKRKGAWNDWKIEDTVISLRSSVKSEEVSNLTCELEKCLNSDISLSIFVEKYDLIAIFTLMTNLFESQFEKYLFAFINKVFPNRVCIKIEDVYYELFGRNVRKSNYSPESLKVLNMAINTCNFDNRIERLNKNRNSELKDKFIIKYIHSDEKNPHHKWDINDKVMAFSGKEFSEEKNLRAILLEIMNCLLSFQSFDSIINEIQPGTVVRICSIIFPSLLEAYLEHVAKEMTNNLIRISKRQISEHIFHKDSGRINFNDEYYEILSKVVFNENINQISIFPKKSRFASLIEEVWQVYNLESNSLINYTFNFSGITTKGLRKELKQYIYHLLSNTKKNVDIINRYYININKFIEYIQGNFKVNYFSEVDKNIIRSFFNYLEKDRKLSPSSMLHINSHLKQYTNWLIKNCEKIKTSRIVSNNFEDFSFGNIDGMSENTEYILEEIIEQILKYANELREDYQAILLLMLNTGLHFKDVIHLTEDCVNYDKENMVAILKYIQWKKIKARRREGLSDFIDLPINSVAYEIINRQNEKTKYLRVESNLKQIFIHKVSNSFIQMHGCKGFNNAVRRMIQNNKIIDSDGKLWHFTSRQCRKTLAVDMIMANVPPSQVANYLNDVEETTNKYYAEVRRYKTADMNSDFWEEQFNLIVPEEQLNKFTDEEKKLLFIDFKLQIREVELGFCSKQAWEGPCSKKNGKISCATCNKLCTGKNNLPKWLKLRDSQQKAIDNLKLLYKKTGDLEYENYREFQREAYLLNSYNEVINKIISRNGDEN